jgi:hypothetical protein
VVAEATKDKKGWHYWFQNQHPAHSKPCRSFRILIQHKKPPRVYQLQFPVDIREVPAAAASVPAIESLFRQAEKWAADSNLREPSKEGKVKSIDLFRPFSEVQFDRFTAMVDKFDREMQRILTPVPAESE